MIEKQLYVYLVTLAGHPLRCLAGPFSSAYLGREAYQAKKAIERNMVFDRQTSRCVVTTPQTVALLQAMPERFDLSSQPSEPLAPETLVVCRYRLPSIQQPWVAPFWVGVVEVPGTDPAQWNTWNSEETYCRDCRKTRVRYEFGVMHDSTGDLFPITAAQAALPLREKILLFLGAEALRFYDLAS